MKKPKTFGERVAHARRFLGLREGDDVLPKHLADRIGVSATSIGDWEAGKMPRGDKLGKLAKELDVSMEWLLTGEGEGPSLAGISPAGLSSSQAASMSIEEMGALGGPPASTRPVTRDVRETEQLIKPGAKKGKSGKTA